MSLKKAKDYLGNDLQVDSAIKDAKGQIIHQTYQQVSKGLPYLATAPAQANTDGGLKLVVLYETATNHYSGYLYIEVVNNV